MSASDLYLCIAKANPNRSCMNNWLKAAGAVATLVAAKVLEAAAHSYLNEAINNMTKDTSRKTYKS